MQHCALDVNKEAGLSCVWAVDALPPSGMKHLILYIIFEF